MATTTTEPSGRVGDELRAERTRAGLTRAQLAALAGCSLAQLGNIEQGAIPRRSAVLDRAYAVLADLANDSRPAGKRAAVTTNGQAGAHVSSG